MDLLIYISTGLVGLLIGIIITWFTIDKFYKKTSDLKNINNL